MSISSFLLYDVFMKKLGYIILIVVIVVGNLFSPTTFASFKEPISHFVLIYMDHNYDQGDFLEMKRSGITDYIIVSLDDFDHSKDNYITKLIPRTFYTMLRITQEIPDANIWIATPHMTSMTHPYYFDTALDKVYDYILEIEKSFPIIWENNIKGVYLNTEAVIGEVDYQNIYDNYSLSFMNDLSFRVHEYLDKQLMWIPYYGYGENAAEVIKKLGFVANTTPIFDIILIQPHYYFDESVKENFDAIFYSILRQEICYRNLVPVIERTSNATATIGFLNEVSSMVTNDSTGVYAKRYQLYKFYFTGLRNLYPSGYYTGGANDVQYEKMYQFYLGGYDIEKLIDYSINCEIDYFF